MRVLGSCARSLSADRGPVTGMWKYPNYFRIPDHPEGGQTTQYDSADEEPITSNCVRTSVTLLRNCPSTILSLSTHLASAQRSSQTDDSGSQLSLQRE